MVLFIIADRNGGCGGAVNTASCEGTQFFFTVDAYRTVFGSRSFMVCLANDILWSVARQTVLIMTTRYIIMPLSAVGADIMR